MSSETHVIFLSFQVALLATLLILPAGIFFGWLLSRKQFWGKSFLDALINIPLVLPPVVTGYFLLVLLGPNGFLGAPLKEYLGVTLAFSWHGAILAGGIVSLPLLVRSVRVAIESVDRGLEDAARMLYATELSIFRRITLPLAIHGIVAGTVLAFARALGEFGATIIFASNIPGKTQTIPLAIFTLINQPGGESKVKVLVIASIVFAYFSMLINEFLIRKLHHART
ncbi:MAG: molybdate ABC transporter permease subunit [Myxococcota bacterium]|nr:molybdate ABC transporter permease subunit [Myxococcota bacterium]